MIRREKQAVFDNVPKLFTVGASWRQPQIFNFNFNNLTIIPSKLHYIWKGFGEIN